MDFGDTKEHIDRLVRQRTKLNDAAIEAFNQVCCHIERRRWSTTESVEWWLWSRTLNLPASGHQIAKALNTSITQLTNWHANPPADDGWRGFFPIGYQQTPPNGPCVYLLKNANMVVYVGSSQKVKNRLKSHWSSDKKRHITNWEVIPCDTTRDMLQLEADLIFQHQPMINRALRHSRGYSQ